MKFTRYMRENSRTLLMVVMALLLVAFLIPDTIQSFGGGDRAPVMELGKAFGQKITTRDYERARAELGVIERLGLMQEVPDSAILEYYLLMEEAERSGIRVGAEEVKQQLLLRGVSDAYLQAVRTASNRSYDQIYRIVGRWIAAGRLAAMQRNAVATSLPRLELDYRDRTQEAIVLASIIDDRAFLPQVPEPTAEELQAFFDERREQTTNHTEAELSFGYRLPDRARVEYLTIDPDVTRSRIRVQTVQVKRYFEENAQRYTKPSPLVTQPAAGGEVPQVPMTFEEAKDRVREDYRTARAIEVSHRTINDIYSELHQPWAMSQRDPQGFTVPPETPPPSFADIQARVNARSDVHVSLVTTGLLSEDGLSNIAGFGGSGYFVGRRMAIRSPALAMRTRGLIEKDPNDRLPVLTLWEPAPVVFSGRFDPTTFEMTPAQPYLFRVIEVAANAPPESMDDLRSQVIADWKRMKAHSMARTHAEALAARAREIGLEAAVAEATALQEVVNQAAAAATQPTPGELPPPAYAKDLQPFTPKPITRRGGFVERVGRTTSVPEAVFQLIDSSAAAGPRRVVAVPVANQHKWVIAELKEVQPLYQGAFEAQLTQQVEGIRGQELNQFLEEWQAPENIRARARFEEVVAVQPPAAE